MPVRTDIVSAGTLSRNLLWGETQSVRTAHATTTLLRVDPPSRKSPAACLLVDPGLPTPAVTARLFERTGLTPRDVTAVFLTNFRPAHRGGLAAFPGRPVYLHEAERDAVRRGLEVLLERLDGDPDATQTLRRELDLLDITRGAPDTLAPGVDLFPLPGFTPGTCGLLVTDAASTTLLAGDAVPTRDHLLAAQILPDPADPAAAKAALAEAVEIADYLVPGHDNLTPVPRAFASPY